MKIDLNVILIIVATIYVLLWIIELVGLHRFNLRFFSKGFKVYEKIVKYKFSNWNNLDDIYSEKEGRYVFLSDEKVGYFVSKFYYHKIYSPIASFRGIPLTIFGKIKDENNEIKLTFYISYRIAILISAWFLAIILVSIFAWTLEALALGIFGILFSSLMIYLIKPFYKGKILMMVDEVSDILKIRK